ncbi:hypothetical protein [Schinkia azotoformans]|uniref:hypothetical protein n=1 Tax=Schinkia azotoformans TaxID=1454 RepID=UPI002DBAA086|nr:hypothetical protein [Schinkia azotoformans]MEC1697764.1 hypothetical protein [Schinkia azotoformans]
MNLFETDTFANDLNYIFESAGTDVLINEISCRVLISNKNISEFEERYIHSLQELNRGELINYQDNHYLIISESITKRGNKFKALMRHCNSSIEIATEPTQVLIGYDYRGAPIYETVPGELLLIPAIVDSKSFSVDTNQAINLVNNQITVTVQDNEDTRGLAINDVFVVNEQNRKLINVDKTKNGLLIFTCELSV